MTRIISIIGLCFWLFLSCSEQKSTHNEDSQDSEVLKETSIEFTQTSVNFGRLTQGEVVSHTFLFKNTGKHNLKISSVDVACGCTASYYTKDIVKPGETGQVEVRFDTKGRSGNQSLSIQVFSNTIPAQTVLHFFAEIESK